MKITTHWVSHHDNQYNLACGESLGPEYNSTEVIPYFDAFWIKRPTKNELPCPLCMRVIEEFPGHDFWPSIPDRPHPGVVAPKNCYVLTYIPIEPDDPEMMTTEDAVKEIENQRLMQPENYHAIVFPGDPDRTMFNPLI